MEAQQDIEQVLLSVREEFISSLLKVRYPLPATLLEELPTLRLVELLSTEVAVLQRGHQAVAEALATPAKDPAKK